MKKKNLIKKIMIVLFFLFIIIIAMIVYLAFKNNHSNNQGPQPENIVETENTNIENNTTTPDGNENSNEEQNKDLKKVNDTYTYFLVNHCLKSFYNYNEYENISLDYMDAEVIENLNLSENNFINLYNSGFCIDEIYKQELKENESIYVVYYRLGMESGGITDLVAWVRVNHFHKVFSIYPYEYLSSLNQLNLKENDKITIENLKDIEQNENNIYEEGDITTNAEACTRELFRRYKFDLLLDVDHLYQILDEEYKGLRFKTLEELEQYIQENKEELYLDSISKYQQQEKENNWQYTAVGNSNRYYTFKMTSLMEYTLILDNYTMVIQDDIYNASLPNVQAKYCINRVIEAIDDKNYEFVYEKLNPVQKNNYYKNIDEFKEFITNHFYDEINYEIDDEYLMISSNVYQYNVKITDNVAENDFTFRNFTMTVTLKENEDFVIAINQL